MTVLTYRLVCAGERILLERLQLGTLKQESKKYGEDLLAEQKCAISEDWRCVVAWESMST